MVRCRRVTLQWTRRVTRFPVWIMGYRLTKAGTHRWMDRPPGTALQRTVPTTLEGTCLTIAGASPVAGATCLLAWVTSSAFKIVGRHSDCCPSLARCSSPVAHVSANPAFPKL
jgi:hypothetical protein